MSATTHLTVLGDQIAVSSEISGLVHPWMGYFLVRAADLYTAIETGPAGTVASHVEHGLEGRIEERLAFLGGEVVVAHNPEDHSSLVGWLGPHHELYSWHQGPPPTPERAVKLFSRFAISDEPAAIHLRLRQPALTALHRHECRTFVEGIGLLVVKDGRESGDALPTWRGAAVRHGEVWKRSDDAESGSGGTYIHASRTAVSVLYADREATVDAVPAFLETLDVSWQAA